MAQAPAPANPNLPGQNNTTNMDVDVQKKIVSNHFLTVPMFDSIRRTDGFVEARTFIDFFGRQKSQKQWDDMETMREVEAYLHGPALHWYKSFGLWQSEKGADANTALHTNWARFDTEFRKMYKCKDDINVIRWAEEFRQHLKEPLTMFMNRVSHQLHQYFGQTKNKHITRCTPTEALTEQAIGLHNQRDWLTMSPEGRAACLELIRTYNTFTNTACITESHWVHCRNSVRDFGLSGVARPEVWRRFVDLKTQNKTTEEIVLELDELNEILAREGSNCRPYRNAKGVFALSVFPQDVTEDDASIYDQPVVGETAMDYAVHAVNSLKTCLGKPGNPFTRRDFSSDAQPSGPTYAEAAACKHCKKKGHKAKDCPTRKKLKCTYCKKPGHTEKECRKKAKDSPSAAAVSANPSPLGGQTTGQQQHLLPPQTYGPPPPNPMFGNAQPGEHLNFGGEF